MQFTLGRCENCDVLKSLLEQERANTKKLIDQIIELSKPVQPNIIVNENPQQLGVATSKIVPWHIKRAQLEEASRIRAAELRESERIAVQNGTPVNSSRLMDSVTIDDLEKELGVEDARTIE